MQKENEIGECNSGEGKQLNDEEGKGGHRKEGNRHIYPTYLSLFDVFFSFFFFPFLLIIILVF